MPTDPISSYVSETILELVLKENIAGEKCYHLDYEAQEYRQDELARLVRDTVPRFALTPDEYKSFKEEDEIGGKRKAWGRISTALKEKKGDYGELILFLLLNYLQSPRVERFVTKVRLRSSMSTQIHGFDCAHLTFEDGKLYLWLGEAKLHQSISSAIKGAIESVEEHIENTYLKKELTILGSNIEQNKNIPAEVISELDKSLNKGRSTDRLNIKIPILLTYDSPGVKKHQKADSTFAIALEKEVNTHVKSWNSKIKELPENITIHLFLLPFNKLSEFKTKMDEIERSSR